MIFCRLEMYQCGAEEKRVKQTIFSTKMPNRDIFVKKRLIRVSLLKSKDECRNKSWENDVTRGSFTRSANLGTNITKKIDVLSFDTWVLTLIQFLCYVSYPAIFKVHQFERIKNEVPNFLFLNYHAFSSLQPNHCSRVFCYHSDSSYQYSGVEYHPCYLGSTSSSFGSQ